MNLGQVTVCPIVEKATGKPVGPIDVQNIHAVWREIPVRLTVECLIPSNVTTALIVSFPDLSAVCCRISQEYSAPLSDDKNGE